MSLSDIQKLFAEVRRDVEGGFYNRSMDSTRSHLIQYLLAGQDEFDQVCNPQSVCIVCMCVCVCVCVYYDAHAAINYSQEWLHISWP